MRLLVASAGKLCVLQQVLPRLIEAGHKILIFSQMVEVRTGAGVKGQAAHLSQQGMHAFSRLPGNRYLSCKRSCIPSCRLIEESIHNHKRKRLFTLSQLANLLSVTRSDVRVALLPGFASWDRVKSLASVLVAQWFHKHKHTVQVMHE